MHNSFTQALENQEPLPRKHLPAEDRRKKFLDAARQVFFSKGYTATSIDDIIRISGGSRRSLYAEFGSKKGLFNELLSSASQDVFRILDTLEAEPMTTETLLRRSGELILSQMLTSEWSFMRLVIIESVAKPELSKLYHDNGPKLVVSRLVELLHKANDQDDIVLEDYHEVAEIFVGMLRNAVYSHLLNFSTQPLGPDEISRLVARFVHVTLHGLAKRSSRVDDHLLECG